MADVVVFAVVAGLIAAALFVNAYRCGRIRGDLPLMLERAGLGSAALFFGCMFFADTLFSLWLALLGLTCLLLVGSTVARRVEDAASEHLITAAAGPTRRRLVPAWLVGVVSAVLAAVPGMIAAAVLMQWGESLTRLGRAVTEPDARLSEAFSAEVEQLTFGLLLTMLAITLLPLLAAAVAAYVQYRRRRDAFNSYESNLANWAQSRTHEDAAALAVDLENGRLARRVGLAPQVRIGDGDQVLA